MKEIKTVLHTQYIHKNILAICSFFSITIGGFCCTSVSSRTVPLYVRNLEIGPTLSEHLVICLGPEERRTIRIPRDGRAGD